MDMMEASTQEIAPTLRAFSPVSHETCDKPLPALNSLAGNWRSQVPGTAHLFRSVVLSLQIPLFVPAEVQTHQKTDIHKRYPSQGVEKSRKARLVDDVSLYTGEGAIATVNVHCASILVLHASMGC